MDHAAHTVDAVVAAVHGARGERDVTFEITRDGRDDRILIAVEESEAFVGLVQEGSVFELADERRASGPGRQFTIGGQDTNINGEFCVALEDAAAVVLGWLAGSGEPAIGRWVKR